jgi:hypothetical protein
MVVYHVFYKTKLTTNPLATDLENPDRFNSVFFSNFCTCFRTRNSGIALDDKTFSAFLKKVMEDDKKREEKKI